MGNRFVYVRVANNFNFPINYSIETEPNTLFENKYYKILEYKGFYAIVGHLFEYDNPVAVIPKTKKLALHQLKTIANVLVLSEYRDYYEQIAIPDKHTDIIHEIIQYDREYHGKPEYTLIPDYLEELHELIKEWKKMKQIISKSESKIEIIRERKQFDEQFYWEYVIIV